MAQIRLHREEVGREQLPAVCMRCGQPATVYKYRTFSWYPPWVLLLLLVGLLPAAIVAMILTKRMYVSIPLCESHKNHWLVRTLLILGSLALVVVLIVCAVIVVSVISDQMGRKGDDAVGFVCLGGAVLFVLWLVLIGIMQSTAIRPTEITDDTITLSGVSERFINAVGAERAQWEEEYEDRRPRSRPRPRRERSEGVYDPEDRGRARRPPGTYEDEDE
jgi:hypothetical protein